ncbi:MAG: hypothetical protein K5765_04230, partial [Clostridia bacterium]|nr:hypothetical protein [Clostridia bacterium]
EYKPTLDFFIDNDNNLTLDISEYISRCLLNPNENDLIYNDVLDYKLTGIWNKDLVLKIYVNAVNYEINIGKTNIKGLSNVYINSDFDMKEFIITKEEFDLINQ